MGELFVFFWYMDFEFIVCNKNKKFCTYWFKENSLGKYFFKHITLYHSFCEPLKKGHYITRYSIGFDVSILRSVSSFLPDFSWNYTGQILFGGGGSSCLIECVPHLNLWKLCGTQLFVWSLVWWLLKLITVKPWYIVPGCIAFPDPLFNFCGPWTKPI
jgi:hypothetical protein